jgi:hypothetical protein
MGAGLIDASRVLLALVCDAVIVLGGAVLLWDSGVQTVVDGALLPQLALVLGSGVLFALRRWALGRPRGARDVRAVGRERASVATGGLVLVTAFTVWVVSGEYFVGWIATYASVVIGVDSLLRLLVDVTTRRNPRSGRAERLVAARAVALETWRLALVVLAVVGFILTRPIHGWSPVIVDPLLLIVAITIGAGAAIDTVAVALRRRAAVDPGRPA